MANLNTLDSRSENILTLTAAVPGIGDETRIEGIGRSGAMGGGRVTSPFFGR